jgi:hypothetical protein
MKGDLEMNEQDNQLFRLSKVLLPLIAGISITLLIEVLADDLLFYRPYGVPFGWFGLWLVTTPVTIAMGLSTLILKSWRKVPFAKRWLIGLGYLVLGIFNVVDIGLLTNGNYFNYYHQIWWGIYIYAAFLLGGFIFLAYRMFLEEESFP